MNQIFLNISFVTGIMLRPSFIDDNIAYVGSANVTPAGLGQGIFTPGNFEVGFLTDNPEVVSSLMALF